MAEVCGKHDRTGMAETLLAHYPRGSTHDGVHCQCGRTFCCSVTMASHQADEVRKTGTWEL